MAGILTKGFGFIGLEFSLMNIIIAVILIVVGIFLGKLVRGILKKAGEKAGLQKTLKASFVELFFTIIQWGIYILFINLALKQLKIPQLTNWLTSILVVIPALVGALLLIVVGFVIAIYLEDLTEESNLLEKKILSNIFFYFVIYVFMVFALKTALISVDSNTVNTILIILTAVISASVAYWHVKKH